MRNVLFAAVVTTNTFSLKRACLYGEAALCTLPRLFYPGPVQLFMQFLF